MAPNRAADNGSTRSPTLVSSVDLGTGGPPAWQRRVVDRSLGEATRRSLDLGAEFISAAATLMEQSDGDDFTVQDVARTAKRSLRSLYAHFDGKDELLLAVYEVGLENYARMIRQAVDEYEDPIERLVGTLYFALKISAATPRGVTIGLARLRARLIETTPDKVAAAQEPVSRLFSQLLDDAAAAGRTTVPATDAAAYVMLTLRESVTLSRLYGPEYRLALPSTADLVEFILRGLGATLPDRWEAQLEEHWERLPVHVSVQTRSS